MSVHGYDAELFTAVQDLVATGELGEWAPAFDIAQRVIHSGYNSLTPKQRALYDAVVVPALRRRGTKSKPPTRPS
jgi:hypothetical protein